jgi:hypothetical protein
MTSLVLILLIVLGGGTGFVLAMRLVSLFAPSRFLCHRYQLLSRSLSFSLCFCLDEQDGEANKEKETPEL